MTTITEAEFKQHSGRYIEQSGKEPVVITRHQRPARVLLDIDEYYRLNAQDTRRHYDADELPDDIVAELEKGFQGAATPELDHLMA